MIQEVIIGAIFLTALFYVGTLIYRSFQAKSCATGCGKCNAVDFNKIEAQLKAKGELTKG